jgi:hypothetical protein
MCEMMLRVALLWMMTSPAFAGCLAEDDLLKGVQVKLQDGSSWHVQRGAHYMIRADQTNAEGSYARYVVARFGVYPAESTRNGQGQLSEYTYARSQPHPVAGLDWTSNARAVVTQVGGGPSAKWREKVHVTVGALEQVQISGCTYDVLAMDMGHLGGPNPTVQHFTYFPELRFGIQTRITYAADTVKKSAVLAMTAD